MTLADEAARARIRSDLGATLVVEAAAGTGKTTELVNRIVAVVASGHATLDRIVAVTFTEKAAGELKLRLRSELESACQAPEVGPEVAARLVQALAHLEQARIGTIHSFCAETLREYPIAAGIDPAFETASEETASGLVETAFQRWFERALEAPGEALRRILRRGGRAGAESPRALLLSAARELLQWRDFTAPWRRESFPREPEIDALVDAAHALYEVSTRADPDDWLRRAIEEIFRPIAEAVRLEGVAPRDYDALEAVLSALPDGREGRWNWKGRGKSFADRPRAEIIAMRSQLREKLQRFRDQSGADLAPALREELSPVAAYYAELKRSHGVLDFLDLLLVARDLVRERGDVRRELQTRFTHIFIDEFQDTDPLQAEILLLLAADDPGETDWRRVRPIPGKLFIVGDPKQSIYRFRRADVALYQSVKRRLVEQGADLVRLTTSFRATPPLQAMVNAVFSRAMASESDSQPAYAPLSPFRPETSGQPPIVALPVPEPYNDGGRITQWAIDQSLPDAIASFIDWLIRESGWTVTERGQPEARVPAEPRHVCVLFRRFNSHGRDIARPYVRALETRHLPHVLIKGSSFSEREEVVALRNALSAIERPEDELAVYATLRGPLFALGDDLLFEFRQALGGPHPFSKLPADAPEQWHEVEEALAVLRSLHRGRNRRPIAETIALLLASVRAHAGFANWPTGEQALSNIMRLMEQARRYEGRGGAVSFRGFVEVLESQAEHEQTSEVPVVEEGTAAIRVMSVHRAKGLEFPVVVLADLTCRETAGEPHRHLDPERGLCALRLSGYAPRDLLDYREHELEREREEAVRLLYVATTRARDLLVVPAVGDAPQPGWLQLLNSAVYPARPSWRRPLERDVPGCPRFGTESVVDRSSGASSNIVSVTPGLHQPEIGEHRVVWWDPTVLKLNVQETTGLRQRKLLEADEESGRSVESRRAYERWAAAKNAALEGASKPSIAVKAVTELALEQAAISAKLGDGARQVVIERLPTTPGRPSGVRFGTLVHSIIRRITMNAERGEIELMARLQGRVLGAAAAEVATAAEAVARALSSRLMRRAAAAGKQTRRECPLVLVLEQGTLVEGVVDLAFPENRDGRVVWTVVDFKTDVDLEARLPEYLRQLLLYVRAVESSTGAPAEGAILAL